MQGHLCAPSAWWGVLGRWVAAVGLVWGRRAPRGWGGGLQDGFRASARRDPRAPRPGRAVWGPGVCSRLVMVVVRWVRAPNPLPGHCFSPPGRCFWDHPASRGLRGSRAGLQTPRPHELIGPPPLDGRPSAVAGAGGGVRALCQSLGDRPPHPGPSPVHPPACCRHPEGRMGVRAGAKRREEAPWAPGGPRAGVPPPWCPQLVEPHLPPLLTQPDLPARPPPGAPWRL